MKYADKLWADFKLSEVVDELNTSLLEQLQSTSTGLISMAAIGDSQTTHSRNYLKQLARINTDVRVTFNQGLGGKFLSRRQLVDLAAEAARTKPDILIIQGGANDIMSGVSSARIAQGIERIIASAKSVHPSVRIFLVTVPGAKTRMEEAIKRNPKRKPKRRYPRPETIPSRTQALNRWIRSRAWDTSRNGGVLDAEQILGIVNKPGLYGSRDFLHYNTRGHGELALALNVALGGVDLRKHNGSNALNAVAQIPNKISGNELSKGVSNPMVATVVKLVGQMFALSPSVINDTLAKLGVGSRIVSKNQILAAMSNANFDIAPGSKQKLGIGGTKQVPAAMAKWHPYVVKWATHFNIPIAMVYAIMSLESGGHNGKTNKNKRTCTEKGSRTSRYAEFRIDVNGNKRKEPFKQRDGCPQDGSRFGQDYHPIHDHGLMQINDRWFYMTDYMNPDLNIKFGCWQINSHMNSWGAKRDGTDNDELTKNILVSYNCGRAGQKRALKKGRDCNPKYVRLGMKRFQEFGGWSTMPGRNARL